MPRRLPWSRPPCVLLVLALLLPGVADAQPTDGAALEADAWQLESFRVDAGLKPAADGDGNRFAVFSDGRFRINAGCGTLTGSYWLAEDRLLFSPHVSALLGSCPDTLQAQEDALLKLLGQVEALAPTGEQLALLDRNGEPLILLARPAAVPLQGRLWQLTHYRNGADVIVPALPDPAFTLRFDSATDLSGSACDQYRARYQRDAAGLRLVGPLAASRFGCRDAPAAARQDADYLAVLGTVASYRVDSRSLLLRDADGRMLARFGAVTDGMAAVPATDRLPPAPVPLLP